MARNGAIGPDLCHLGQQIRIVIGNGPSCAHHFRQINRHNCHARRLQQLFGIAHGLERPGTRANRPQTRAPQPTHSATQPGEALKISPKLGA